MILTGQANKDFSNTYNMSNFNDYSEVVKYALIIQWFDSVGIFTEVGNGDLGFCMNVHVGDWRNPIESFGYWNTRIDATATAISIGNKIYNQRFEK